ncbi:MAG: TorF family putative porin [Burkholderiales bacterium]|nr:TorF family putative porin [Burkholderiales bacterium]
MVDVSLRRSSPRHSGHAGPGAPARARRGRALCRPSIVACTDAQVWCALLWDTRGPRKHRAVHRCGLPGGARARSTAGTEAANRVAVPSKLNPPYGVRRKNSIPTLLASAVVLSTLPALALADDTPAATAAPAAAAPAAAPADPLTFNIGVFSDYRYRGISQTRKNPALQGGADYAAASGAYVGTWLSNINWIKDAGTIAGVDAGKTPAEWDLYGGFRGDVIKDQLTFDVGGLYYEYVGNKYGNIPGGANASTFEIYGQLTAGIFTAKYSDSLTNLFGNSNSKNSGYLDLTANIDLGNGMTLTPELAHQSITHYSSLSYTMYSLTFAKDFGNGIVLSAQAQGTDAKKINGVPVYASPAGKNLADATLVVGVKYTF